MAHAQSDQLLLVLPGAAPGAGKVTYSSQLKEYTAEYAFTISPAWMGAMLLLRWQSRPLLARASLWAHVAGSPALPAGRQGSKQLH